MCEPSTTVVTLREAAQLSDRSRERVWEEMHPQVVLCERSYIMDEQPKTLKYFRDVHGVRKRRGMVRQVSGRNGVLCRPLVVSGGDCSYEEQVFHWVTPLVAVHRLLSNTSQTAADYCLSRKGHKPSLFLNFSQFIFRFCFSETPQNYIEYICIYIQREIFAYI